MNTVFQLSVRCSAFCPGLTFTIERQNKFLSLVTTFSFCWTTHHCLTQKHKPVTAGFAQAWLLLASLNNK
jgi:hypothetical protein